MPNKRDTTNPQKTAKKNPNIEEVKLGKKPFEFDHPLKGYGGEKRSGVEMVIPQEVREIINQLQKKVDQIKKDKMKDKEKAKKYRDQDKEKIEKLEELVGEMVKKMTAWKQELDVFNKRSKDAKIFSEAAHDHTT
jgi:hypothetical protein